jgi:hypothetical protein
VTFCERLRLDCVQSRGKIAFGPEKTRLKKALIISFVAKINENTAFYFKSKQIVKLANFTTVPKHLRIAQNSTVKTMH